MILIGQDWGVRKCGRDLGEVDIQVLWVFPRTSETQAICDTFIE